MRKRTKILASLIIAAATVIAIVAWRPDVLVAWLLPRAAAWAGLPPVSMHVTDVGWSRLEITDVAVGDATARRIVVEAPWKSLRHMQVNAIVIDGLVLSARWADGVLSFGALDSLRAASGDETPGRGALPFQSLAIQDGEFIVDSPGGALDALFDARLMPSPAGGVRGSIDIIARHDAGWLRGAATVDVDAQDNMALGLEVAEGEAAVTGIAARLGKGSLRLTMPSQGPPSGTVDVAIERLAVAGHLFTGLGLEGGINGTALRIALAGGEAAPGLAIVAQAAVSDLTSDDGAVTAEARLRLGEMRRDPAGGALPYDAVIGGDARIAFETSLGALRAAVRGEDTLIEPRMALDLTMQADATPFGPVQSAINANLVAAYSGSRLRLSTGDKLMVSLTGKPPGLASTDGLGPVTIAIVAPPGTTVPLAIDADLRHGTVDAVVDIAFSLSAAGQDALTGALSGNAAIGMAPFALNRWRVIDLALAGGSVSLAGHRLSVETARLSGTGGQAAAEVTASVTLGYDGQPLPGLSIQSGSMAFDGGLAWRDGRLAVTPTDCLALAAGGIRWPTADLRTGALAMCLEAASDPLFVWRPAGGADGPVSIAGSARLTAPLDLRISAPASARLTTFLVSATGTPSNLAGRIDIAADRVVADTPPLHVAGGSVAGTGRFRIAGDTATLTTDDCLTAKVATLSAPAIRLTAPSALCLTADSGDLLTVTSGNGSSARLSVAVAPAGVSAQLGDGETMAATGILPALGIDAAWQAEDSAWSVAARLDGGDIVMADGRVGVSEMSARLSAAGGAAVENAEIQLVGATVSDRTPAPAFTAIDMSGSAFLQEQAARFNITIGDRGGLVALSAAGEHEMITGRGHATFGMPTVTFGPDRQPQQILPLLRGIVTSVRGSLDLSGDLSSAMAVSLTSGAVSTQIAEVSGITAMAQFDSIWPPSTPPDQTLSIAAVDVGVPLADIRATFQVLPGGAVLVHRAAWPWMDGTIQANNVVLDPKKDRHAMVLEVSGVRVERLLEMIDLDDFIGTGSLSGRIPVEVIDGTPYIRKGRLATQDDGVLSYSSESVDSALRAGGQGGALLADALKDFRYKSLVMEIDGATTGDITARVSLAGSNPDLYDSYPIELNTSFEGNLGQIMRGARATYAIPDGIRQRLEGAP